MSNADYDAEYEKYIHKFNLKGQASSARNFVHCKVCLKYPKVVQLNSANNKVAPITTKAGTRFRRTVVEQHFSSLYHEKCKEAERINATDLANQNKGLMDAQISEANKKVANHIGKLCLQVYADAKKLTSSAFSWPARYIASEASNRFEFNANNATIPSYINIQYVNPSSHLDLLTTITQSHREEFKKKIESARTYSIHIDGSVDRTQIDKIYILL